MLSDQQITYYTLFGFIVLKGWFKDERQSIIDAFETTMSRDENANKHDGSGRTLKWQMADQNEFLRSVFDSDKVTGVFNDLLGSDWQYFGSVGNLYAGDTGWHTDSFSSHHRVKMALYLDPTRPGNGGLSVIPLSHVVRPEINELHLALGMSVASIGTHGSDIPSITLETEPGDAVVFNHNLSHSAWHGGNRRRMLSFNAHAAYDSTETTVFKDEVLRMARFLEPSPYGQEMIDTADDQRMRHLEQALSLKDEFAKTVSDLRAAAKPKAKDILPDLSVNTDPQTVVDELVRDSDYEVPASWYERYGLKKPVEESTK